MCHYLLGMHKVNQVPHSQNRTLDEIDGKRLMADHLTTIPPTFLHHLQVVHGIRNEPVVPCLLQLCHQVDEQSMAAPNFVILQASQLGLDQYGPLGNKIKRNANIYIFINIFLFIKFKTPFSHLLTL